MKFVLFVEGQTERNGVPQFLKRWLDPKLPRPVRIQPVLFEGAPDFVKKIRGHVHMHCNGPAGPEIIAAIGLLDLYEFPGLPDGSVRERCRWAVEKVTREVGHPKFRMHLAVHELEAWILSDPSSLPPGIARDAEREKPETVNFNEPPAKLLDRLYKKHLGRSYKKRVYGPQFLAKVDIDRTYRTCPYLKSLLDEMLDLAKTNSNS